MNTNEFLETVLCGTHELDREALFLRYYSHYSFPDIADILSISVDKARGHCRRGVKKVMRNVLNATPIQKVSLENILRFDLMPARRQELGDECDVTPCDERSSVDEPRLQHAQRPMVCLWFDAA